MLKKLAWILPASIVTTLALPAFADIILPSQCHMGMCIGLRFLEKTLLEDFGNERFYSVELQPVVTSMESGIPPTFEPETHYVLCSTTRPTHVFRGSESYLANFLNPGLDDSEYGYSRGFYPIYWVTCHNFVGPEFFSQEMTNRAINLGYPLNLQSDQVEINNPRDILTR